MKVLVTGATGFIGVEVASQLAASPHDLRVMVRRPLRAALGTTLGEAALSRLGTNMVTGDTVRGWNLDFAIDAPEVWEELGIEPRFPTIREGIPATLDGVVAFLWQHPVFDPS